MPLSLATTPAGRAPRALRSCAVLAALLVAAPTLGAQASPAPIPAPAATGAASIDAASIDAAPTPPTGSTVAPAGPVLGATRAGVHTEGVVETAAGTAREAAVQERKRTSTSTALMIVGAAGIVIGAVTDSGASGALILGGAVVGLTGLYLYLR